MYYETRNSWEKTQLEPLNLSTAYVLCNIAYIARKQDTLTSGELYDVINDKQVIRAQGDLGSIEDRRALEIINELETIGIITTWNTGRNRKGFGKTIKLHHDPSTILGYFLEKGMFTIEDI